MRWFWIDRFVEFESGKRAKAVKNVSLAEEHLHDHLPGFPIMPSTLMIEGMAQTGGILLGENSDFEHIVVLAKVPKVEFLGWVTPGETITYSVTLLEATPEGGIVACEAHVEDRLVATAEIMFAHLDASDPTVKDRVDQKNFVFSMGLMSILEVGSAGDGAAALS